MIFTSAVKFIHHLSLVKFYDFDGFVMFLKYSSFLDWWFVAVFACLILAFVFYGYKKQETVNKDLIKTRWVKLNDLNFDIINWSVKDKFIDILH
jgi:Ca2+/Na+ antiporter